MKLWMSLILNACIYYKSIERIVRNLIEDFLYSLEWKIKDYVVFKYFFFYKWGYYIFYVV